MNNLTHPDIWFVCGSQHLYGPRPLEEVAENAQEIANALNNSDAISVKVVYKALLTTPAEIRTLMLEAESVTSFQSRLLCQKPEVSAVSLRFDTLGEAQALLWSSV